MRFEGLFILSTSLRPVFETLTSDIFWLSLLCALIALALFVIVHGFLRHKHA
jgi:ABC-type uncharacterized transport system permease subunit